MSEDRPMSVKAAAAKQAEPQALEEGPRKTRRSRIGQSGDNFYIPEEWKQKGMDYQWWVIKVYNTPVDDHEFVMIADGGWEVVRPSEMPGAVPRDYKGNSIERFGQRLYKRPMYLTDESRAEDARIAREQRDAKIAQVYGTDQGQAKRSVDTLDITKG